MELWRWSKELNAIIYKEDKGNKMDNKMANAEKRDKKSQVVEEESKQIKRNSFNCNWWILIERLLGHKMKENGENSKKKMENKREEPLCSSGKHVDLSSQMDKSVSCQSNESLSLYHPTILF